MCIMAAQAKEVIHQHLIKLIAVLLTISDESQSCECKCYTVSLMTAATEPRGIFASMGCINRRIKLGK